MAKNLAYFRDLGGEVAVDPLLAAMAERLDVDLASTEGLAELKVMQQRCTGCRNREHCRDWIASSDSTDHREFCANTNILDRIWLHTTKFDKLCEATFKTKFRPGNYVRLKG